MTDGPSASPSAGSRTPASTVAPRRASSSAVARPMPDDAPVTSTVRGMARGYRRRVRFADLAAASEDVRAVSGRREKSERLACALAALALEERAAGAGYLAGA